ncbi:MAG: hypothetical protein ACRDRW_08080 [Pseudonocardiaceae bacterium]
MTGLTAERWATARERLAGLWQDFGTYQAVVAAGRTVRNRRARPGDHELAELVLLEGYHRLATTSRVLSLCSPSRQALATRVRRSGPRRRDACSGPPGGTGNLPPANSREPPRRRRVGVGTHPFQAGISQSRFLRMLPW